MAERSRPSATAGGAAVRRFTTALRQRIPRPANTPTLPATSTEALRAIAANDNLADRFVQSATAAGARVHHATSTTWPQTVVELLTSHDATHALLQPEPDHVLNTDATQRLRTHMQAVGIESTTAHDDETLFSVGAAVTNVAAAIAETGTIVCLSGPLTARGASLIPPVHIALVEPRQIRADLFDVFDELDARHTFPTNINLITGPSKTADIEGILITGVHGPGTVHVVLCRPN